MLKPEPQYRRFLLTLLLGSLLLILGCGGNTTAPKAAMEEAPDFNIALKHVNGALNPLNIIPFLYRMFSPIPRGRLLALGVFSALFLGAGIICLSLAMSLARSGSKLFSASLAELRKDREALATSDGTGSQ